MDQTKSKSFNLRIKKSRMWIPAIGVVVAYGFLHNCFIQPIWAELPVVDWANLLLTFSILIGLGGAREVVMRKFQYLSEAVEKSKSQGFLTNKVWIPTIGWCLFLGFLFNFCLSPFFSVGTVEWSYLQASLSIMLTVSGFRDYGLYRDEHKVQAKSTIRNEGE